MRSCLPKAWLLYFSSSHHFRLVLSILLSPLVKKLIITGYKFTYPFMSSKVEIRTDDNHVEPVYKYLVHMDMPNLFFMGLPGLSIPFPMFHIQVPYILGVIEGRIKLPSPKQMREEFEREKNELIDSGIPVSCPCNLLTESKWNLIIESLKKSFQLRHINKLKDRAWGYYDEIAAAAGVPSFPPVVRKVADHSSKMRELDLNTYKNYQYRIVDNENFTVNYYKPC